MFKVAFRVDADSYIGAGHLMRCLTLADSLYKEGAYIRFICRDLPGSLAELFQSRNFDLNIVYSKDCDSVDTCLKSFNEHVDAIDTLNGLSGCMWDCVIVDHYGISECWESEIQKTTNCIMVIDDLANRMHQCQILLDQNYYLNGSSRYLNLVPASCKLFLGPEYALLRDEFTNVPRSRSTYNSNEKNILVSMGGGDRDNLTLVALEGLAEIENITIMVVVGASNPNKVNIKNRCGEMEHVEYIHQTSNMAELMANADICIGAGGATTWERCMMGLPSIVIITADNQKQASYDVAQAGACLLAGMVGSVTSELIKTLTNKLLSSPDRMLKMKQACLALVGNSNGGAEAITSYLIDHCEKV